MFVISYLDSNGTRYDVSSHTKYEDAQVHYDRLSLTDKRIDEKETFNPKPEEVI